MTGSIEATGNISVADCLERQCVILQPSKGAFRAPVAAYAGQNLSGIANRLPQFRSAAGTQPLVPPVRLDLITIRNGWLAIGANLDGMVFTEDGRTVRETAMFTRSVLSGTIELPCGGSMLDEVFVGFDGGWSNWYHWLCFALGRSALAAGFIGAETQIVLPDYTARPQVGFSELAWRQSLEAFGLTARVRLLPPGLHHARAIHLFWTTPHEPTNLTYVDAFQAIFARVRRRLAVRPDLPRRLLLSRGRSGNPRISVAETALVEEVTARHGFVPLRLETLDFRAQAEALFNADCVVGVHGAGMTNVVFGRELLRVLELQLKLDGESLLRPWFYLLAYARRQRYMMLDRDVGDLSRQRLDAAIDALCGS